MKHPKDESIVYVRSFGGFAIESTVLDEAKALSEALYKDDLPHEKVWPSLVLFDGQHGACCSMRLS